MNRPPRDPAGRSYHPHNPPPPEPPPAHDLAAGNPAGRSSSAASARPPSARLPHAGEVILTGTGATRWDPGG